jgi:hypothetical protein
MTKVLLPNPTPTPTTPFPSNYPGHLTPLAYHPKISKCLNTSCLLHPLPEARSYTIVHSTLRLSGPYPR